MQVFYSNAFGQGTVGPLTFFKQHLYYAKQPSIAHWSMGRTRHENKWNLVDTHRNDDSKKMINLDLNIYNKLSH